MQFQVDVMLGTLARWLRILGHDTGYRNRIEDDALVQLCLTENRILLTRDSRLVQRRALKNRHLLIPAEKLADQIREVVGFFHLSIEPGQLFTRCLECNQKLQDATRELVRDQVPVYVFQTQSGFRRCPACRRVYWPGTHRLKMMEFLHSL